VLVASPELPLIDTETRWPSAEVVSLLANVCIRQLHRTKTSDTPAAKELIDLLLTLQQLSMDWYLHQVAASGERLADCASALGRLRGVASSALLLESVCEEVVLRCGFHRAAFSKVEGRGWRPVLIHDRSGPSETSWFTKWGSRPVPFMDTTPEAAVLSTRQASLVDDTSNAPVYRPFIVQAGQSSSYVSAPLVCGTEVFGLLHSDHYPLPRRADAADRDVLWTFADSVGRIYERALLQERCLTYRDDVRDLLAGFVDRIDEICEVTTQPRWGPDARGPENAATSEAHERRIELSRRELEVLELMADGATNREIAEMLVIAEDTVKTHVQRILRKYGATNRTQLIALALRDS
jgi:DNA-binding CsgD family transcriptional regulator